MAAILELIDFVVGQQRTTVYNIAFENNNNDPIVLEQELETHTTFAGFGRNIELKVNE